MQRPVPAIHFRTKWSVTLIAALMSFLMGLGLAAWLLRQRPEVKRPHPDAAAQTLFERYNLRRHFDGESWGTFWDYCGVTLTADHVAQSFKYDGGLFTGQRINRSGGLIDAAWYGKEWTCAAPSGPAEGLPVILAGYPSGSDQVTLRYGTIYLHRSESGSKGYEARTWIVKMDSRPDVTGEPVVGGMSGGIVVRLDYVPIGLITTQNSPADLDGDGRDDHSADIVGLDDVYRLVIAPAQE